jgi:hypothetical protein
MNSQLITLPILGRPIKTSVHLHFVKDVTGCYTICQFFVSHAKYKSKQALILFFLEEKSGHKLLKEWPNIGQKVVKE